MCHLWERGSNSHVQPGEPNGTESHQPSGSGSAGRQVEGPQGGPRPQAAGTWGPFVPPPPAAPPHTLEPPLKPRPLQPAAPPSPTPHSSKALPPLRPPPHHEVLLHPCPEPHLGPLLCRPSGPLFQLSLQVAGPRAGPGRPTHPPGLPSPVATRMQGRRGKQVLIPEQAQEACVSVLGSL